MSDYSLPLIDQPHHDGSALYVPNRQPRLGDIVTVRLRVPAAAGVSSVFVRIVPDGEHTFIAARQECTDAAGESWWVAELPCRNPVLHYRFLLDGGPTGVRWLNAAGLWHRDVPDQSDFRITTCGAPPAWVEDAVVYQIFPDRFATTGRYSNPAPDWAVPARWTEPVAGRRVGNSAQLYGGDLDGIAEHLDHLARLGVNVIYLTPFFPARSNHRYDASTFSAVDPLLGGEAALRSLCEAAHAHGMRVLGDFTANHTGDSHEWFRAAVADAKAPERDFYIWDGEGGYESWLGVPSMPKLNHDNAELRRRLFDDPCGVIRRWLDAGLDGWRIDVANMTGRNRAQDRNHEVARWLRDAAVDQSPDALVVAEHVHDFTPDLGGDGWHGVMNYSGFTKPVWTWLLTPDHQAEFLGAPVVVPRLNAALVVDTIRDFTSRVPWQNLVASFNLLGSHDTSRVFTLLGGDKDILEVAIGLLLTMPSVPMITYGDEIGMEGSYGEDGRRPMPWNEDAWDRDLFATYRDLIAVREGSTALRHGGLRWLHGEGDALVFLREAPDETVLVHCARARHAAITLPLNALPGIEQARVLFGSAPSCREGAVELAADRAGVRVLAWSPRGHRGTV